MARCVGSRLFAGTDERGSYVLCIIQKDDRDDLRRHLLERGIESPVYYGIPLHLQKASVSLGCGPGDFPVAEEQARRVLTLPHHQCLSEAKIRTVASEVNAYYA